ncbi:MAG: 2Fe-2S iron-sulfur cluster-binding protein [Sphingomonadaceae bacterium]
MHSHEYFQIPIAEVVQETDSAVSLILDVPSSLADTFQYKPGQFLTLRVPIDGKMRQRCYSLASAPGIDTRHKIAIKRVEGGMVSNHVCSSLKAGDLVEVQPPAGLFVPASLDTDFLLFAGGSGITPVLSILKAALSHGRGHVTLLYANRDEQSVIFRNEIAALSTAHPERLTVLHWLESLQGLPTVAQIAGLVRPWSNAQAFICGPEPFMAGVSSALQALGVDDKCVHLERFVSLPDEDVADAAVAAMAEQSVDSELKVSIDGGEHVIAWSRNVKMLDAMLEAGIDAPYSCRVGGCSACMCKVLSGRVRMAANLVLDDNEIAEGWVLGCQSFPETDHVSIEIP